MSRSMANCCSVLAALSACSLLCARISEASDQTPIFETDIQPIFAVKCEQCHNAKALKGGLDVTSIAGIQAGGESGDPLLSRELDKSPLWQLLNTGEMPPADKEQLAPAELELIRQWLLDGAKSKTAPEASKPVLTQHDVLPILLLRCTACHGPRVQSGNLDLHNLASLRKGGQSGPALVSQDPDASLMITRVESGACPPSDQLLKYFVKRPSHAEVQKLRTWIAAGAPEMNIQPDMATTEPDPLVSDADRKHWAFQSPRPASNHGSVDSFIAAKLVEQSLKLSPEADRDTLIRRVHLDLVGMPPSVTEWQLWRSKLSPNWYGEMIDHLLASPNYGERWGRYWLDVAGYADSEGGISADPIREVAWKYRDYVIGAFNSDKPYDRFLLEQLAGDELLDYENQDEISPAIVENLIATGFLRMGIDETGSRTMNFVPERLGVINDAITVVSSGVMGLTMECARCHSHKYDPIPQRDYYRLKAIFQGALDEHDWLSFKNRTLQVGTQAHRARIKSTNPAYETQLKKLETQLNKADNQLQLELLRHHFPEQTTERNQATLVALKVADNNRTLHQRMLVERLQFAQVQADAAQSDSILRIRREIARLAREMQLVRIQMEPPLAIRALWDRGDPSPTYILKRGEYDQPGRVVGPGVPSVLTDGKTPFVVKSPFPDESLSDQSRKTGRRLAFARWLTQSQHPLTARVMVNRIWFHHFGSGLVKSLENFGVKGDRPTHPELLDWLAVEFARRNWSIKEMHRLIMNSQTYRQSSQVTKQHLQLDPHNQLVSRFPLRRMDAEALRDSLLSVSGVLDRRPGGIPDTVSVNQDGLVTVVPSPSGGWRRSVYLPYRRTEIPTMISTFDYPEMGPNCLNRSVSSVSPQALLLMNNGHVRELASLFAKRIIAVADERVRERSANLDLQSLKVDTVYALALSCTPSTAERQLGLEALQQLEAAWGGNSFLALESYCHTIFNSAEFLYVD